MAPRVPLADSWRGRELAVQRRDDARGRLVERLLPFSFGALQAGQADERKRTVTSLGGTHVRLVAMRGGVVFSSSGFTGLEAAAMALRLNVNNSDMITDGRGQNRASFAMLFGQDLELDPDGVPQASPWLWFSAPPRLRVGDILRATASNTGGLGEGNPAVTVAATCRFIDDEYWAECYLADREHDDDLADAEGYAAAVVTGCV